MEQKLPAVVITNYQQYINAGYLVEALMQTSAIADNPFFTMYASVAYVDVRRVSTMRGSKTGQPRRAYETILALSIKGKTHTFKMQHDNEDFYIAKAGLDVNNYGTIAGKDNHIRVFQKAFEEVVDYHVVNIATNIALR